MALDPERRAFMRAMGAPSWEGRTAELLIEAATGLHRYDRFEGAMSRATGRPRNMRDFYGLTKSGVLEYTGELRPIGQPARLVSFTPEGAQYALDAISDRIGELTIAKNHLLVITETPPDQT